ncbi:hypothetical protein COOONC_09131 [Cooperia oncophora]
MGHVAFYTMMRRSIFMFFMGLFVSCLATEHVLQLRGSSVAPDPPASAVLISVPVNSSVTLRCEKSPNLPNIQWLHNGNDLNLKVLRVSGDEASSIHIEWYLTKHHDGVYECYAGPASASIRLRGEDEVVLPPGFRFCHKSENAACDHTTPRLQWRCDGTEDRDATLDGAERHVICLLTFKKPISSMSQCVLTVSVFSIVSQYI